MNGNNSLFIKFYVFRQYCRQTTTVKLLIVLIMQKLQRQTVGPVCVT